MYALVLWEFCIIRFSHIQPLPAPLGSPFPSHFTLCPSLILNPLSPICATQHVTYWDVVTIDFPGAVLVQKADPLFPSSSMARGGTSCPPPLLAWACTGLVHAVTVTAGVSGVHMCSFPHVPRRHRMLVVFYHLWRSHSPAFSSAVVPEPWEVEV